MFIINLTYKTELDKIEHYLTQHIKFLDRKYQLGNFLASGAKVPRTGGIILSNIESKLRLQRIIAEDPFKQHELADYELIEFTPSKTCEKLRFLMK